MSLRASIDLGTNTCLLLIAECDEKGRVSRVVSDHSTIVRLGQGVDRSRELQPEAIERTLACLRHYAGICRAAGIEPGDAICVGTSSSRDARNGSRFYARVEKETGLRFRVLSGEDEAKYTFLGGLPSGVSPDSAAVIDIGGGSTELITASGGLSLDMGSVRFTERYLQSDPVTDSEFWACQEAIDSMFGRVPDRMPGPGDSGAAFSWRKSNAGIRTLVAVAGTATTLAAWHFELVRFEARAIDEGVLTRGDVHRQVEELKWRSTGERKQLPGVDEGRADVLLAGAMILWRAMELLGFPEARVSTRGLRFGILSLN